MTLYRCNGCERLCVVDFDRCGDGAGAAEVPEHCLFDGQKIHNHDDDPEWYHVREVVTYKEIP